MIGDSTANSTWTRFEDKLLNNHALYAGAMLNGGRKLLIMYPGGRLKMLWLTMMHLFMMFLRLIREVEPPSYPDDSFDWESDAKTSQISFGSNKKHEVERKRGLHGPKKNTGYSLLGWTIREGDWRSISRNVVVTRTPTQVASHAQKYYLRQQSMKKERKRSSIHVAVPPQWIRRWCLPKTVFRIKLGIRISTSPCRHEG
ncbi:hypothetical protein HAX54_021519 [Datura stramonium]|uniref:HTH myb-type domain-containing protein n=1 Tax=Datura stramonium TaxID=4076 RepID=A0ABS8UV04_DATST|nr:hypothetical protein [Datura stramonium]